MVRKRGRGCIWTYSVRSEHVNVRELGVTWLALFVPVPSLRFDTPSHPDTLRQHSDCQEHEPPGPKMRQMPNKGVSGLNGDLRPTRLLGQHNGVGVTLARSHCTFRILVLLVPKDGAADLG